MYGIGPATFASVVKPITIRVRHSKSLQNVIVDATIANCHDSYKVPFTVKELSQQCAMKTQHDMHRSLHRLHAIVGMLKADTAGSTLEHDMLPRPPQPIPPNLPIIKLDEHSLCKGIKVQHRHPCSSLLPSWPSQQASPHPWTNALQVRTLHTLPKVVPVRTG